MTFLLFCVSENFGVLLKLEYSPISLYYYIRHYNLLYTFTLTYFTLEKNEAILDYLLRIWTPGVHTTFHQTGLLSIALRHYYFRMFKNSIMPIAYLIHDDKFKVTHEIFFQTVKRLIPGFKIDK